jgi:hypothetical protein
VRNLDDVRSDFSVYHRVDEIEHLPAERFVAYTLRLPVYGGATAYLARRDASEPQEPSQPRADTRWQDISDLMKTDPDFRELGSYVQVPAA